jgi:hypothetical protein
MLGDFIGGLYFGPPLPSAVERPRAIARTLPRYKVADNNSPIPRTRLLYSYNFYDRAFETSGDVHRHFIGGELLLWGGRFSVESRISLNEFHGFATGTNEAEVGDLRTTVKVPFYEGASSLASAGLAVGWPVGDMPGALSDSNIIFAPFIGYLYAPPGGRWFAHGFGQLDIPTEADDVILLHTDLGVGYFLRRQATNRLFSSIVPTAELHLYTPFDDATGIYSALDYDHVLNGTVGATFVVGRNLALASGVSFPLTDEQHYAFEYQFHLSWRLGGSR